MTVTYFQIYGGKCLDLLNDKNLLNIMEDKNGSIQIPGLTQRNTESAKELLGIMEQANTNRTTHATVANDTSSRSHAICQVFIELSRFMLRKVMIKLLGNWFLLIWLVVRELRIHRVIIGREGQRELRLIRGIFVFIKFTCFERVHQGYGRQS